jgi:hypothetical protein
VPRPALEVADILKRDGDTWRQAHAGHISLEQFKVMSAIERCRTDALGGHRLHCDKCDADRIAYHSCRNRHCPKCQARKAEQWLAARQAQLLPVEYYHVVFTLPAEIADIAYQNKALVYGLLFKVSAQTLLTIAADPKHLGARLGVTSVLHTWGSALTHHPHVHALSPVVGSTLSAGCLANAGSFCRCVCCHDCSGVCSLNAFTKHTVTDNCSSSATWRRWPAPHRSRSTWRRSHKRTGTSMPSNPLPTVILFSHSKG